MPSEQAILQAIRSVCDRVGVGSLKEKQIEALKAIVFSGDGRILAMGVLARAKRAI